MRWPPKEEREEWEIRTFLEYYEDLPHGRTLVIESKGDSPDYIVRDPKTGDRFGVELTSVYLDDRSVPEEHIQKGQFLANDDKDQRRQYRKRIVEAIADKVEKARKAYDRRYPLILSVYANDYTGKSFTRRDFQELAFLCEQRIGSMAPFCEVVFSPIGPDQLSHAPGELGHLESTSLSWRPKGQPHR